MEMDTEFEDDAITLTRAAFLDGAYELPVVLGLTSRAIHTERSERECLNQAMPVVAKLIGPAATLVDVGYSAGTQFAFIASQIDRLKSGIVMWSDADAKWQQRITIDVGDLDWEFVSHSATDPEWPIKRHGNGTALVTFCASGFGLLSREEAFDALDHASDFLASGDFLLLSLDQPADAAILEGEYHDYCSQIVSNALGKIGQHQNLNFRLFTDAMSHTLTFGALAGQSAQIGWNGTICSIPAGTWIKVGSVAFTDVACGPDLHPDFGVAGAWTSSDAFVSLLLLRKI